VTLAELRALVGLLPGRKKGARTERDSLEGTGDIPARVARIEACEKLARAGGRDPSEDAFYEAFRVLTGQLS